MTNEEAIRIINGKAPLIIRDREGGICDKTDELKTTILSALEKQIPKELIKLPESEQHIRYTDTYRCPTCGGNFSGTGIADYCYHCGQRLDWGKQE